jgi:hypothetical protein
LLTITLRKGSWVWKMMQLSECLFQHHSIHIMLF